MDPFDELVEQLREIGRWEPPISSDFTARTMARLAAIRPFGVPVAPLPAEKPSRRFWWVAAAAAAGVMLVVAALWAAPRLLHRHVRADVAAVKSPAPQPQPEHLPSPPPQVKETPVLLQEVIAPPAPSETGPVQWFFRPTGKDPHDSFSQLAPDFDAAGWRRIGLPFCLNPVQPQEYTYAWYVCRLEVPAWAKGRGLLLDLGTIDDVDVTYVNGTAVGKGGAFEDKVSSAWNQDRLYAVPKNVVKPGRTNVVAVKMENFTGLGGMMGRPCIGVLLQSTPEAVFLPEDGEPAKYAAPDVPEYRWAMFLGPATGWPKEAAQRGNAGWYRYHFDLPPQLLDRDLLVDLGRIYDAAECYLNGKLIGQMGRLAGAQDQSGPQPFLQTGGRFRVILPRGGTKEADNVLAIRVRCAGEFGGLLGAPMLAIEDQDLLLNAGTAAEALNAAKCRNPNEVRAQCSRATAALLPVALRLSGEHGGESCALDLCEYMIHSGAQDQVADFCERVEKSSAPAATVHRARCMRVYALWLAGKGVEAWKEYAALDFAKPVPYSTTAAMADYCRANSPATRTAGKPAEASGGVLYLGKDAVTRGDWDARYGLQEAVLCAMTTPFDVVHGIGPGFKFSLATGDKNEVPRAWLGAPETDDVRSLWLPETGKRRYASWDDRGEIRPFDDNGPDLVLSLSVPQGPHMLSFYLVDWDWAHGPHPRVESLLLLDAAKKPLTVVSTGKFGAGQYERFFVEGPKDLTVRFGKHRSPCVVVSGVFLDNVLPLQPAPDVPGRPLPGGPGSVATRAKSAPPPLQAEYEALAKESQDSIIALLEKGAPAQAGKSTQAGKLEAFEKSVLESSKEGRKSNLLWYLAECRRVRGDFAGSQEALSQYLTALGNEVPAERVADAMRSVAWRLDRLRYRPEAILAGMSAAAAAKGSSEAVAFAGMLKQTQLESLRRLSGRWLAMNPPPRADFENVPLGGMLQ